MKETTLQTAKYVSSDGISNVEAGYRRRQKKSIVISVVLLVLVVILAAVMKYNLYTKAGLGCIK